MGAVVIDRGDILTDPRGEKWKVLRVKRDVADLAHLERFTLEPRISGINATVKRKELDKWRKEA
jgi:hypothetical protein